MFDFWEEWRDVQRHNHPVTVEEVLIDFKIEKGKLDDLEAQVPRPLASDSPSETLKKGLASIWVRLKQYPKRRAIWKRTKKVREQIMEPARLRRKFEGEELYATQAPFITDFAYILDLFASQYGWTEQQIRKFPYAALSELVLAMENRWTRERVDMVNAAHPSEESMEYILEYPKRSVKIPAYIRAEENIKKARDLHSTWSGVSEDRLVH